MMDSQDNALNQGTEEVKAADAAAQNAEVTEQTGSNEQNKPGENNVTEQKEAQPEQKEAEQQPQHKVYTSKKEIVERIKEIANSDETPDKNEVEYLKSTFYKLHFAEREAQQKAYLEAGGDPEKYQVLSDEDE